MNRPLFSIATPCWNSAKTIEKTIKSILAQSFKDYEYIIVDGGSTDGTIDIIKKYEPLFEGRMKWKSELDKGLYDAFNKGVSRSSGVFCWNVNSDDWIEEDALAKLADFIKVNSIQEAVIVGDLNFVDENNHVVHSVYCSDNYADIAFCKDRMIPHPATIVAKSIYEKFGAFDIAFKVAGDMDWFNRVYAKGVKFCYSHFVVSNMSMGGATFTQSYETELKERKLLYEHKYSNEFTRQYRLVVWKLRYLIKRLKQSHR